MKTNSLWQSARRKHFAKLKASANFDVVIVGGGLTGLTAAYLLKKSGKRVCLLERDRLGSGDTSVTTAHLTYVTDLRIFQLAKTFGDKGAAAVLEAGAVAIDTIESIIQEEKIRCDFKRVPGFLCSPFAGGKEATKSLKRDADVATRLGLPVRYTSSVPYFDRSGLQFPDQAKFHPLKYLAGLADAVVGDGSVIYEQTEVNEVQDDPLCVVAGRRRVTTEFLVIATHVPLMGKTGMIAAALFQTKLFPYSSYAIGAIVPKGLLPEACYWDTSDPYYYLRVETGKASDYVIYGGEDHKTGQETKTDECYEKLRQTLHDFVPRAHVDRYWSGQVVETNDGLPYIGETSKKQFVATGFSGNGMTFGTVAGLMARDAALGRKNPWQELFSVHRKKIRGGTWSYLTENIDYPYYYLADRLSRPAKSSPRSLKRGEGKIFDVNGQRAACSRDDDGTLHSVSACCTHMGCIVRWNRAEQTWDCPCHGSRFRTNGEVLGGPAETPLEPVVKTGNRKASGKTKRSKSKSSV